jgi:hypothetical protein
MFRKLLIHLLTKVCRCPVIHLVVFQVSHPYKSIDFTTAVKESEFGLSGNIFLFSHTGYIWTKAPFALFIWLWTSSIVPPTHVIAIRYTGKPSNLCVWKYSTNLHVWKLVLQSKHERKINAKLNVHKSVLCPCYRCIYRTCKRRHCCDILPAVKARYSSFIHTQKQEVLEITNTHTFPI